MVNATAVMLCRSRPAATAALQSIIRVDHAGELGADRIYAGQMAVLGNTKSGPLINEMWQQEKQHRAKFEQLIVKHRVRPTALTPLWNIAGYMLGAGTALLGEKAAMACTVAVETVIVEHYNEQLRTLMAEPEANKDLLDTIRQFRDEEQQHHDHGMDHGAEQAPMYSVLTEVIKRGCRAAISVSKRRKPMMMMMSCRMYSTDWHIMSGICIERKPVVTKPFTEFEKAYKNMLDEIELSSSYKSMHELRAEEDKNRLAMLKQNDNIDSDIDSALKQSAQDYEDAGNEELNRFRQEHLNLEQNSDPTLCQHLLLLTQYHYNGKRDPVWTLPHSILQSGENLRDAANRIIIDVLGKDVRVQVLGNAPFGFYKFKYPKNLNCDALGAKLFIFKGIYQSGTIALNQNYANQFQWALRSQISHLIKPAKYLKSIEKILIDEEEEEKMPLESVKDEKVDRKREKI